MSARGRVSGRGWGELAGHVEWEKQWEVELMCLAGVK